MSSAYRMRWRPALGVVVLGAIAVGLGIQGASAERARSASRDKKEAPQAGVVTSQRNVSNVRVATPTSVMPQAESAAQNKKQADLPPGAVAAPNVVGGVARPTNWQPVGPEDLEDFSGVQAVIGSGPRFQDAGEAGAVATGTTGACCLNPGAPACSCVPNQTLAQCNTAGGVFQGVKTVCANDICGCLTRACCDPAGACIGDQTRVVCEGAGNTWNIEASCVGAAGLPQPFCNVYNVNNCNWDNGGPLNDGGASRSHTFSGAAGGQLPRYDFNTADDFILRGPDSTPCQIGLVTAYHRARPADTTGPVFTPPNPATDYVGMNVTVFSNYVAANTGLDSPGGHGNVPFDGEDLNPKVSDTPGGVVYARTFPNSQGAVTYTLQPGFCDPPPAVGFETDAVYKIDIAIDPPILLNKNRKYWMDVQGLFPFNDGLRETLQTWAMPSVNNTGFRLMTQRTGNPDYVVGGLPAWVPNGVDLVPGGNPPQNGNTGNVAPCAGVGIRTRWDMAFSLTGVKDAPAVPNDVCLTVQNGPQSAFDGYTAFDNTGAITDGPGACAIGQDIWFRYTATCSGVLTVETCDSTFDSAVAVYLNGGCPNPTQILGGCSSAACGDDGSAEVVVAETADLLIRVGGDGAAVGKGTLYIRCDETCGRDDGVVGTSNCCLDHSASPPGVANLGCENLICCEIVCQIPGEETCCDDSAASGGWDSECALIAGDVPACGCPCPFTCPGSSDLENEPCLGPESNTGCSVTAPPAGPFEPLVNLALGTPYPVCGTTHAASGSRDVDWYDFNVPATASGFATLTIELNSSAQVGLLVFTRDTALDVGAGEDFCYDKVCSGATACEEAVACTNDSDCQTLQNPNATCDTVGATLLLHDAIATGSCEATDGDPCEALVTCVPAPNNVKIVALTAQAANDTCGLGDGIFDGFLCGGQDSYSYIITATNDCADGACCMYNGTCEDGSPGLARNEFECFLAGGSFAGEGETCEALPPDVDCVDLAHGCALAQTVTCGSTTAVNLQTDDHFPEEPYPCGAAGNDPNDRWWGKFVLTCVDDGPGPDCNDQAGPDTASVRVDTCTSVNPGRDSLLGVYGSCCPPSGLCPGTGSECTPGVSLCGGACNATTPLGVAGCGDDNCGFTDFLSDACVQDLIEGETYYIQISNWAEPVNGIYQVRVTCPCAGSCCDPVNATCQDDVPADLCPETSTFTAQFSCTGPPAQPEPPLNPACGVGACCAPNGTCTNVTDANCPDGSNHNPGSFCSSIVCNAFDQNQCDYNTGDPTDPLDQGPFGFRSQYAADIDLFLEIADQFELKGSAGNDCEISTIFYSVFHTSHDTANGCQQGGGSGCADSAGEYEGIVVTISEDVAGDEKNPSCEPDCTASDCQAGADGDYHLDPDGSGCQSYAFGPALGKGDPIPSGNYWTFEVNSEGQTEFYITLHFQPPIAVEKNKKNWLAITHVVPEFARYSVIWFASNNFNGNYSRAYSTNGTFDFEPLDATPNDQLFMITGAKQSPGCGTCAYYGDIAPSPEIQCLIDVGDLLNMIDGVQNGPIPPITAPRADIAPCSVDAPSSACVVDADCRNPQYPLCVSGTCGCTSDGDCATFNVNYPFCNAGKCECGSDGDCAGSFTGPLCITGGCRCAVDSDCADLGLVCNTARDGGRCEGVDVDDLLNEIDSFQLFPSPGICPPPCPPGACVGDFGSGVECRDGDPNGAFFIGDGMSEGDCFTLTGGTGTYCGDFTVCDPDGTCPP